MPLAHRRPFLALSIVSLIVLGGCSGPVGTKTGVIRAPQPPAEYNHVSSSDLRKPGNVGIMLDPDTLGDSNFALQFIFGLAFSNAMREGKPPAPPHTGSGAKVTDAILFEPIEATDELNAIGHFMAATFPGTSDVMGHLYRDPHDRYLVWVQFKTEAGSGAIYFDASRWASARKSEF